MGNQSAKSAEFQAEALTQYAKAVKAGYRDERYRPLIDDDTVQAAHDFVGDQRLHPMFLRLCGDKRFDLTIEWLVLRPQFRELFDASIIDQARVRLARGGFGGGGS